MKYTQNDHGNSAGLIAVLIVLVFACLASLLNGCTPAAPKHLNEMSWDQENLKRHDTGCPTAVFVAPGGDLVQCQLISRFDIKPLVAPPEYDTPERAAIEGFKIIARKPTGPYFEWGGMIVKMPSGKYSALAANTSYQGDSVSIQRNDFGLNASVVGAYHTHPCLPEHDVEFFSEPDLIGPIFYRQLAFMGDFCTGNVHEFVPGDKPDAEPSHNPNLYLTKGRIIGMFTYPHVQTVAE